MLQEEYGSSLTQALALASCYRYITCEDKQPWEDYTPKVEEPKEEVRLQVLCSRSCCVDSKQKPDFSLTVFFKDHVLNITCVIFMRSNLHLTRTCDNLGDN